MILKVYTYYYNSINRSEKNEKIVKILDIRINEKIRKVFYYLGASKKHEKKTGFNSCGERTV